MDEQKQMRELVDKLNELAYHYYVLEKPIMSDYDYDTMYDQLVSLEEETGIVLPDSPTLRVGGDVLTGFKKVEHKYRLYSLNKCNDLSGIEKFVQDVSSVVSNPTFTVEYKFDGLRIIAEYQDGSLIRASTRGDGYVGEDVTEQVKTIKSVPLSIDYKGKLIVAGEGVITLSNLELYNKTAEEKLKNARNAVAGAIRNLDPKVTAKRNLDVVFYDIIYTDNKDISSQEDVQIFLTNNKFLTGKLFETVKSSDDIKKIADKIDKIKTKLDIQIDGLVIKLNNLKQREELGYTAKYPKWAIAYKFAPVEMTSTLLDVDWRVGKTGKVTPIALLEPIDIAGATVSRATLNNYEDIMRKDLKLNSLVFVRRSNEVIPEVLGVAQHRPNSVEIVRPSRCPCCNSPLFTKGPNIFCYNPICRDKVISRITSFVSRESMNIDGLSEKIIALLYDTGFVRSIADLYRLDAGELCLLDGFKDKKINNLLSSIQNSKDVSFSSFLNALSIEGVGTKTSKDLAKKFNYSSLLSATISDLVEIEDIGDVTAENIVEFFKDEKNIEEINSLFSLGVHIKQEQNISLDKDNFFYGKKFVLTGTLQQYSRTDATNIIESFGGSVSSSVSKNTDYVIYGEEAGSKLDKAKTLGVALLSESEFLSKL